MAQIHACPKPTRGMLPFKICNAAVNGKMREVLEWLEDGGDINAADMNDCTLVFTAANLNHVQLLKELLKYPKVHLNQHAHGNSSTWSPIAAACNGGFSDCMEALLTSPSECRVDIENAVGLRGKVILACAHRNQWNIVELILKTDYMLEENDACTLMRLAVKVNEMDIVKSIMQRESIIYKNNSISGVLQDIYKRNKWNSYSDDIFRQTVFYNNDSTKDVLLLVLEKKDWNRLEILLRMMNDAVKINVSLAEAISKKSSTDVERILAQEHMEADIMDGALLVASIGGTSAQIVDMLFGQKHNYSAEVLENAFLLACRYSCLELLPTLFRKESFTYKTLCRGKSSTRHFGVSKLLDRALKKAAKEIIPLDEDEIEEDEIDEDEIDEDEIEEDKIDEDEIEEDEIDELLSSFADSISRSILIE